MEKWATVNIDLNKLIDTCSNGRKSKEELLKDFNAINDNNIHEVFKYRKFNDGFIDKITCYSDGDRIIGIMCPSYKEFLEKIFTILNVNPQLRYLINRDDQDLEDILKARIEVLRCVQDEADLYNEFPLLYKDLQDGRAYINDVRKRERELKNNTTISELEREKQKEKLKKDDKHFRRCALSPGFTAKKQSDGFIYKQIELYTRFVERRKEYKKVIEQNDYNKYINNNFDLNKIALYVVYGYLNAIDAYKDRDKQLKYYHLVELYLNNPVFKKDVEIFVDGIDINYDLIVNRAKAAEKKLNRVDIKVEWELLPTGSGYDSVTSGDTTKRRVPMSEEKIKELIAIGKEQTEFFMNTNYSAKAIGLKKFAGYFAYIYPNGVVVLDKDFREKYPTTAEGAIYVMRARDFELLSGIGKTDLIKHPFLLGHRYHRGDWKTKINAYIKPEGTEQEKEEAIQLIKKMQK